MKLSQLSKKQSLDYEHPILIFEEDHHQIYWLGMMDNDAFRTNIYVIIHGEEALLVDPGDKAFYPEIRNRLEEIGALDKLIGGIFCHQDPDVAGSIADWVNNFPAFKVICSGRTQVLLPHYGIKNYDFYDTGEANQHQFQFSDGYVLKFVDAPFLHFPGAIASYDPKSEYLFSGDVWAAIDIDVKFIVQDFESHQLKMNLFHLDYMSSSVAARGFAASLSNYSIQGILPQHGSLIEKTHVEEALAYLKNLRCGLDLIYPNL